MNEVATKEDLKILSQDLSRDILRDISKLILENNVVLIPMIGKMMGEKIAKNNDVLISLIDKKIKDNNEYIFEHFNDQTDRILNLFKGVMRVNKDGNLGIYF